MKRVRQTDFKDCGAACMSYIIQHYNGKVPLSKLKDMTFTDKFGTNAFYMEEAFKKIGFEVKSRKGELKDLDSIQTPCIIQVILDAGYLHFVVALKYNRRNKSLEVFDPAHGKRVMKMDELNTWTGFIMDVRPVTTIPVIEPINYVKQEIKDLFKRNLYPIITMLILTLITMLLFIIDSYYLKLLIDSFLLEQDYVLLVQIAGLFALVIIFKNIFNHIKNKALIKLTLDSEKSLSDTVYASIMELPYHHFLNKSTGELIARMNAVNDLKLLISEFLTTFLMDALLLISVFIILFFINPTLASIGVAIIVLNAIIMLGANRRLIDLIRKKNYEEGNYLTFLYESIATYDTTKSMQLEATHQEKHRTKLGKLLSHLTKYQYLVNRVSFAKSLINQLGNLIMITLSATFVMQGIITMGDLILFNTLFMYLLSPIDNILKYDEFIRNSIMAVERINEIKQIGGESQTSSKQLSYTNGDIKLKNVSFAHNKLDNIINNLDLEIKAGTKAIIQAPSGSGKSTLCKLFVKYFTDYKGVITINNTDIKNINYEELRKNVRYLAQNEQLFTGTLRENLSLDNEVTEEDLKAVSKLTELKDVINKSFCEWDMLLEENGANLSGGERQRVVLARTLLKPFDVLILDEALSQVDIPKERKILKALIDKYKDKTILYVSHRPQNHDLFEKVIEI